MAQSHLHRGTSVPLETTPSGDTREQGIQPRGTHTKEHTSWPGGSYLCFLQRSGRRQRTVRTYWHNQQWKQIFRCPTNTAFFAFVAKKNVGRFWDKNKVLEAPKAMLGATTTHDKRVPLVQLPQDSCFQKVMDYIEEQESVILHTLFHDAEFTTEHRELSPVNILGPQSWELPVPFEYIFHDELLDRQQSSTLKLLFIYFIPKSLLKKRIEMSNAVCNRIVR